jgi:serine/threonine protein kinase
MTLTDSNKLGEGAYGIVYKILAKESKTAYAVKIFKVPFKMMNSLEQLGYEREHKILKETSHPFVIKYIE